MEDSNKVVVKVKYQGLNQWDSENARPQMVTEWHTKRILGAIAVLFFLILLPFYYFSDKSEGLVTEPKPEIKTVKQLEIKKPAINVKERINPPAVTIKNQIYNGVNKSTKVVKKVVKEEPVVKSKTESVIVANTYVERALLTTGLINKEPIDNITSSVKVSKEKATGLYYFTEINDMKGQTVYHQWLKDEQIIYKRRIDILGPRWRAATSKLITYLKAGMWAVRLVNEKGDILNEIKFEAVAE